MSEEASQAPAPSAEDEFKERQDHITERFNSAASMEDHHIAEDAQAKLDADRQAYREQQGQNTPPPPAETGSAA